jgi:hypothetical protein
MNISVNKEMMIYLLYIGYQNITRIHMKKGTVYWHDSSTSSTKELQMTKIVYSQREITIIMRRSLFT